MKSSIAIYPSADWKDRCEDWKEYMQRAARHSFSEVFTTLHLPEFDVDTQLKILLKLSCLAKEQGMELTADIGGGEILQILENKERCENIRNAEIAYIRLDYGFSIAQAAQMYRRWGIEGFVINASIYSEAETDELIAGLKSIDTDIKLRACHNYYPRPESGLERSFFLQQNQIFYKRGIPVYACIPSRTCPRLPLMQGLPTLEEHRTQSVERVTADLVCSEGIEGLMAADEYFSEEELRVMEDIVNKKPMSVRVQLHSSIGEQEREIVTGGVHHIRYDSNQWVLRSQSSREMSQIGSWVTPKNCEERTPGTITIDNSGYGRYSGELQIVRGNLPKDDRVNCVGRVVSEDMWKLDYYRYGYGFYFIPPM